VARTPPESTLDWVLGVIGGGARIVETRTFHGDEPPWQLPIGPESWELISDRSTDMA
jgi:hypothetical protein